MKRYSIYFLLSCMLLLTGCTHTSSNTSSETNNQKEGKTIITLGIMYDDGLIAPMINSYNKENNTYYIELKSYETYDDPCQQFLLDVSSGKAPDIIEVGTSINPNTILHYPSSFLQLFNTLFLYS